MFSVQNIRLGFANNSSSSHSIVFLRGKVADSIEDEYEFGWEFFTAASKRTKENYLISTVARSLVERVGKDTAGLVLGQLLGRTPSDISFEGYVDHQSSMLVPQEFHGKGLDVEFWNDLQKSIMADGVVVLGGNDNEDHDHPLLKQGTRTQVDKLPTDCAYDEWVARKDGDIWALFNRKKGDKLRFSFVGDMPYDKSSLPELCDVAITDYCPYGCNFCYRGSTTAGKHADEYYVYALAERLSKERVFEVALGGGETTLHPNFIEILKRFRAGGVVPNFTTRNLQWLRGENRQEILDLCGSFAFSTEKESDIRKLVEALDYHGVNHARANLQFIAGVTSPYELYRLCEACIDARLNFTVLGYKTTGRGEEFKPKFTPAQYWTELKKLQDKHSWVRIGIDTVFASQIEQELQADGVSSMFYHTKDGVFSCYIDAVGQTMAPSSYCDASAHQSLVLGYQSDPNEFGQIYRSFASK